MALLVVYIAAAVLLYIAYKAIYNLFFHPLADCPGPLSARISSVPSFYHASRGDRHLWIWKCFQIYGDRVRATPDVVLFRTPRASNDIYGSKSKFRKSNFYDAWPRHKDDFHTLNTTDLKLHAKKKRLLNLALAETPTRIVSVVTARHTDRWLEIMLDAKEVDGWSTPHDLAQWTDWLALDIMGDLVFGRSFNAKEPTLEGNPFKGMSDYVVKFLRIAYAVAQSPLLDFIIWLKPRGLNTLLGLFIQKEMHDYEKFVADSVAHSVITGKEKRRSDSHGNIIHALSTIEDPATHKPALSMKELLSEAHLLNISGRATTAFLVSALVFYICHNPRVYKKLTQEIRAAFATPQDICPGKSLSSCYYLKACINETFRMAPPGTGDFPRKILRPGATIDGIFYPAGTVVGISEWAAGYNEAIYHDAGAYRPERWIMCEDGPSADEVEVLKAGFHPFSQGPGKCPGQQIAMTELMMILGRTLHRADIRLTPGSTLGEGAPGLGWGRRRRDQYQLEDLFLAAREGPSVQFKRRAV